MENLIGRIMYIVLVVWVYIGKPAIFLAAVIYALATRTLGAAIVLVGILVRVLTDFVDTRIIEAAESVDVVYSNIPHLLLTLSWHLSHLLIAVGVMMIAVQALIKRMREKQIGGEDSMKDKTS